MRGNWWRIGVCLWWSKDYILVDRDIIIIIFLFLEITLLYGSDDREKIIFFILINIKEGKLIGVQFKIIFSLELYSFHIARVYLLCMLFQLTLMTF